MMRKSTMLWLVLAFAAGTMLFHTSQLVTDGRAKLAQLQKKTAEEEESIRVLQAEWSYLNKPGRLEKLASEYLDLQPMQGKQFATLEEIEQRPAPAEGVAAEDAAGDQAPQDGEVAATAPEQVAAKPAPAAVVKPAAKMSVRAPVKVSVKEPVIKIPVKPSVQPAAKAIKPAARPVIAQPSVPTPMPPVATPPHASTAAAPSTVVPESKRRFGDVMKSLGVD